MASNKRTIYLGLDYSQFTGGVTEVNRKMGLLDAEFKLAQQQAKNYGNETDVLGTKTDFLRQKIALQTQKVEAAKKAYDEIMSTQGASAKQIDALDKKLLNERTALEKLKGELTEAEKAQEGLNNETKSFGDEIRGLVSSLGLNVSPAIESLASHFDGVSSSVGNAVLAIGAIGTALVKCATDAAETADNLLTLSKTTGMTTDELQKLQYASAFVDVDLDTMTGAITRLERTMRQAKNGSSSAAEAFKELGVKITSSSGQLKDANELFYDIIDRLGRMKNETERDALAMDLLGKSAKELNPLIEVGSKRLKELGIEAEDLGVIMGGQDLEALGQLKDAMDKFDATTAALKQSLGLVLLPILTDLFEAISAIPVPVLKTLVILASVVASIMLVVKAIKSITDTATAISKFGQLINGGISATTLKILGIVAALIALATVIAVIIGRGSDLNSAFSSMNASIGTVTSSVTGAQQSTYSAARNASGTTNFDGGRTWVGEEGPELVTLPRGSQITPANNVSSNESNVYNITIDAKNVRDFQRVVELAQQQKMATRRI